MSKSKNTISEKELEAILNCTDGSILLEYVGNYYEYIGTGKDGRLIFQDVSDDSSQRFTREEITNNKEARFAVYKKQNRSKEKECER